MRTLPILLCSLLVLAPAEAQQTVQHTTPNFYVPYGVRDLSPAPLDEYSSSDAELEQPYDIAYAAPDPQMRGHYPPMGRRQFRPYGNRYGAGPQLMSSTAGAIVGLCIATFLLVALATPHD